MIFYLFKHYSRTILRRKLFSFINITGLAFGIAFIILIGQFIYYEVSYNSTLSNVDNIYRLVDADAKDYNIDYRIKDQIIESIPGVTNACLLNHYGVDVEAENKFFKIQHMLMVDSDFFEVFRSSFIYGNSKEALNSIDNIVLTETTAKNIFGTPDVIGKTLRLNHQSDMLITGVVKDFPENLSFGAELFVSFANAPQQRIFWKMACDDSKCRYPFNVFIELDKNANVAAAEERISSLHSIDNIHYPDNIILTPLSSDYFNTDYNDSDLLHGNVELIKLLSIIGVIVLLLAIINFVNLTTASYRYRLTEFGIKKCLGAGRKSLMKQILAESFFTTVISTLFGIMLAEILLPYFNRFINKSIELQFLADFHFLLLITGFVVLISFILGIFPSLILSKISPIHLFKFEPSLKGSGKNYRNILTTFQFSIAIALIAGLIIIFEQIDFVKHRDPGFRTDQLLYLKIHHTLGSRVQILSDKLNKYHGMKSLTKTFGIPGEILLTSNGYETITVDSASLETFGFRVLQGRNLLPGDNNKAVLINQTALNQFRDKDWKHQRINGCEIAGVVSDFQYSSLHNKTGALMLWYSSGVTPNAITMRISGPVSEAMRYINKVWKEVCPDYPVEINFYDEYFASMYRKEENLASLVSAFSILAVVISCMGIFGLSVFQSQQRIKEIGVRKVFGASVSEIVLLLTKSFSVWVILANVVSCPVAYYFMNEWLQNFAYRIDISWWMFALAGGIGLLIALVTVSFQAIKAATANPVEALKYE